MLKNYLKTACRYLYKNKFFSAINIVGLAIGITACLLIMLYVQDEFSFDRHYDRENQIYRVTGEYSNNENNEVEGVARTPYQLASILSESFSSIEKVTRLRVSSAIVKYQDKIFQENKFLLADSTFFGIFNLSFVKGSADAAAHNPQSIVITEETANKYFPDEDPIGKTLEVFQMNFQVAGVVKNTNQNSHFKFDLIASMTNAELLFGSPMLHSWGETAFYTYIKLKPGANIKTIDTGLAELIQKHVPERAKNWHLKTQSLTAIHLHSNLKGEIEANGNFTSVKILIVIAFSILLIACINFINMSIAFYSKRIKEISVRKTVGAKKWHLIKQFYTEIVVYVIPALLLSLLMTNFLVSFFNSLSGKELAFDFITNWQIGVGLGIVSVFICIVAGSYPAIVLSSLKPFFLLKRSAVRTGRSIFRNSLVVFQFTISICFIAATLIISSQLHYMLNKDYGFKKEQLITTTIPGGSNYETAKKVFMQVPGVDEVSFLSRDIPFRTSSNLKIKAEGMPAGQNLGLQVVAIDYNFIHTINAKIKEGRDFSQQFITDGSEGYILNESAVKMIGWQNAIGKKFETDVPTANGEWQPKPGKVIGIVEDFHLESLQKKIEPTAFYITPVWFNYMVIRVSPNNIQNTLAKLKTQWKVLSPNSVFSPKFTEEAFSSLYEEEARLNQLVKYFSMLLIIIACLGLFALAAFSAERRAKEIGIRKVLGASVLQIIGLLSKEFLKLVAIAIVIASPVAWWVMSEWLQDYAYRINIGWWIFTAAGVIALVIAMVTVSFQAIKAALSNPVKSLKTE